MLTRQKSTDLDLGLEALELELKMDRVNLSVRIIAY